MIKKGKVSGDGSEVVLEQVDVVGTETRTEVVEDGPVTTIKEVPETYWRIQSLDYLFLEVSLGLILYPGSHAYITGEQKSNLPKYSLNMVQISEITEAEYKSKIGGQGLLGLG